LNPASGTNKSEGGMKTGTRPLQTYFRRPRVKSGRMLTLSLRSKPKGGADLRVSRGLVEIPASAAQQRRPTKDSAKIRPSKSGRFPGFSFRIKCGFRAGQILRLPGLCALKPPR
jgi:hypothetical protein